MNISGISINVQKKNIKNIHLYIKPPLGEVNVTAPSSIDDKVIEVFVRSKLWEIKRQQEKFREQQRQSKREYVSGETFYLFGNKYYLRVNSKSKKNLITIEGDVVILSLKENSTIEQRENFVNKWYREQLLKQIERILPKLAKITGLCPQTYQVRYMTTHWGTCKPETKKIILNLQLAKKEIPCIEYVVLHELVHLVEKNHGDNFVKLMDQYMPYWREIRKKLNDSPLDNFDK